MIFNDSLSIVKEKSVINKTSLSDKTLLFLCMILTKDEDEFSYCYNLLTGVNPRQTSKFAKAICRDMSQFTYRRINKKKEGK